MSEGEPKYKPPLGVILGALSLVIVFLLTLAYFSFVALRKATDSQSGIAMFCFGDFAPIAIDPRKLQSAARAEFELLVATEAQGKDDYLKFHNSMERAESEFDFALGAQTQTVSMLRLYHATIEAAFRKWSVAESLERIVLKNLPDSQPYREIRFDTRRLLAEALEEQGKYDEALQIRLELLAEEKGRILILVEISWCLLWSRLQISTKSFTNTIKHMMLLSGWSLFMHATKKRSSQRG